jgi:predicted AlkP superfamily phosphohydrolase/phosphomutase
MTYPPQQMDGYMITGLMTPPNREYTYPHSLKDELTNYKVEMNKPGDKDAYAVELFRVMENRFLTAKNMLKKDWNLFFMVFQGSDRVSHRYLKDSMMRKTCRQLDRYCEELVNLSKPDNILILSDHGFSVKKKAIKVNQLLKEKGFLVTKKSMKSRIQDMAFKTASMASKRLRLNLADTFGYGIKKQERFMRETLEETIDFKGSTAYYYDGHVHIKEEYSLNMNVNIIRGELEELPITIHSREDKIHGPFENRAGQLLLECGDDCIFDERLGEVISKPDRFEFYHSKHGFYASDFAKGNGHVYDIAPTLLNILNLKVPPSLDGIILNT